MTEMLPGDGSAADGDAAPGDRELVRPGFGHGLTRAPITKTAAATRSTSSGRNRRGTPTR